MSGEESRWEPESRRQAQNAMWSIYLHTVFRNGLKPPALPENLGLEPVVFRDAVLTLVELGDHHAPTRRALALRKIVASGLNKPERLAAFLGRGLGNQTRQAIEALADAVGVVLTSLDPLPIWVALRSLLDFFQLHPLFVGDCEISNSKCMSCHDGITLNTTVTGSVGINRNLDYLVKSVDPRSWAKCNPYFLETRRVKDEPGYPTHDDNDKPLGEPWTGLLYEKVQSGPVIFENVLEITQFTKTATRIFLEYGEHKSLQTHFPTHSIDGGIEIDHGTTTVEPGGSVNTLTMEKTLRFVDLSPGPGAGIDYGELLNYWTPAILCLWVDEDIEISPCCDL